MDLHWIYGTADFTEEGDEELAELYRLMTCDLDGLYHYPSEAGDG